MSGLRYSHIRCRTRGAVLDLCGILTKESFPKIFFDLETVEKLEFSTTYPLFYLYLKGQFRKTAEFKQKFRILYIQLKTWFDIIVLKHNYFPFVAKKYIQDLIFQIICRYDEYHASYTYICVLKGSTQKYQLKNDVISLF